MRSRSSRSRRRASLGGFNPTGISSSPPVGGASISCGTPGVTGSGGSYIRVGTVVAFTLGPCAGDVTGVTGATSHSGFGSITAIHVVYPDRSEQNGITTQFTEFQGPGVWAGVGF